MSLTTSPTKESASLPAEEVSLAEDVGAEKITPQKEIDTDDQDKVTAKVTQPEDGT